MNVHVALDVHVPNFTALDMAALWLIPIFVIVIVILSIRGIVREIHKERYGDYDKSSSKDTENVEKRDEVMENGDWYCKDCGSLNSAKTIYCSCGSKKSAVKEEKE